MQLTVSDTSILIDMEAGGLLTQMFELPFKYIVPDALYEEELKARLSYLKKMGLTIKRMRGELIGQALSLRKDNRRTSTNDLLALVMAEDEGCLLITGDRGLRGLAESRNINVHGTIWLIEQMVVHNLINVQQAEAAFRNMVDAGSRLPVELFEEAMQKYK